MELGAGFDKEGEPLSEEARTELEPCIQDVVAELEAEPFEKVCVSWREGYIASDCILIVD